MIIVITNYWDAGVVINVFMVGPGARLIDDIRVVILQDDGLQVWIDLRGEANAVRQADFSGSKAQGLDPGAVAAQPHLPCPSGPAL